MQRYVAFATPDYAGWAVLFPDFPDIVARGVLLEDALRRAERGLNDHAHILRILGSPMPPPQRADDLVRFPLYRHSMGGHHRRSWPVGARRWQPLAIWIALWFRHVFCSQWGTIPWKSGLCCVDAASIHFPRPCLRTAMEVGVACNFLCGD
jgi:predicted RNase H-like HicB family nuclease